MKRKEAINLISRNMSVFQYDGEMLSALRLAIEALKEMPVEEYRQRLIDVFHRTDHDELLTYVVMPKEEEFKSLEYILRQYKFEPRKHGEWDWKENAQKREMFTRKCTSCGSRGAVGDFCMWCGADNRGRGDKE